MSSLKAAIQRLASLGEVESNPEARQTFLEFREQLTHGKVRAAEKIDGQWRVAYEVFGSISAGSR